MVIYNIMMGQCCSFRIAGRSLAQIKKKNNLNLIKRIDKRLVAPIFFFKMESAIFLKQQTNILDAIIPM